MASSVFAASACCFICGTLSVCGISCCDPIVLQMLPDRYTIRGLSVFAFSAKKSLSHDLFGNEIGSHSSQMVLSVEDAILFRKEPFDSLQQPSLESDSF